MLWGVTDNPIPAGAWIRVSTADQAEKSQVPDIERHCADRGYVIARRYELNDRSAYLGEQEAVQEEALADMRAGAIKVLVCWAADRVERRGSEATLAIFRRCEEAGGRLESVLEPFLSGSPEDAELMRAIIGWKDRAESARKRERIRISHAAIDANGGFRGRVPWGYRPAGEKLSKRLEATPEGRKYIPVVYEKIADGETIAEVAQWLTENAGPRRWRKKGQVTEAAWWPKSVSEMVRRSIYMGYGTSPAGTETHLAEPLVSPALWAEANARLDAVPRRGPASEQPALLKGIAFCGECGGMMLRVDCGNRHKDGTRTHILYYRCWGRPGQHRRCGHAPAVQVQTAKVDAKVSALMVRYGYRTVTERHLVQDGTAADIAVTEWRIRQLPRQFAYTDPRFMERTAELVAELSALKAKAEPDRWEDVPTGRTFADNWSACATDAARNDFLRSQRFRVTIWKDRMDIEQGEPGGKGWSRTTVPLT